MSDQPTDSDLATPKARKLGVPWRRDPIILQRLPEVERRHLRGDTNVAIAAALGVDEGTIRADIKHLNELWLERIKDQQEVLRAQVVASLVDVRQRSLEAADFDRRAVMAVLFGQPFLTEEGDALRVHHDDHGKAEYRPSVPQSLNNARQATMDIAKVLGVIVEPGSDAGTEILVRIYERGTHGSPG